MVLVMCRATGPPGVQVCTDSRELPEGRKSEKRVRGPHTVMILRAKATRAPEGGAVSSRILLIFSVGT